MTVVSSDSDLRQHLNHNGTLGVVVIEVHYK